MAFLAADEALTDPAERGEDGEHPHRQSARKGNPPDSPRTARTPVQIGLEGRQKLATGLRPVAPELRLDVVVLAPPEPLHQNPPESLPTRIPGGGAELLQRLCGR